MSHSPEDVPFFRRRSVILAIPVLLVLGVIGLIAGMRSVSRSELDEAVAALHADDPARAREVLDRELAINPENAEVQYRAAQAARRCGDLPAAGSHLQDAAKLGWNSADIERETLLIRVQEGHLRLIDASLLAIDESDPEARHTLSVLVPAMMADFRWVEAKTLVDTWIRIQPSSPQAWACLGEILERLRQRNDSVNAYREAARLNPADQKTRFSLARLLLETRKSPDEAAGHLEWLLEAEPNSVAVQTQLAVCRESQGKVDQAIGILDRLIASVPPEANIYFHRGRIELSQGRHSAALPFLKRSCELDPSNQEALYSLFLCIQQVGTPAEAQAAEERWKRCVSDLKRVGELAKLISVSPRNPDLRAEIGELYLRNGRDADGLHWLESALREQADHPATHRSLYRHYLKQGQAEKATLHQRLGWPGGGVANEP